MLSYGLKPYNVEDCEQALEISRSMKGKNTFKNYHKTIFIKISFLEKLKRFIQRPLFLTSSLRVDLALARTDKWQDSKIVLLNFKSTMYEHDAIRYDL